MASPPANVGPSELGLFQEFLVSRTQGANLPGTLDEAVLEFREYQQQFTDLQKKLRVAEQQNARGEVAPFDAEATKQRLRDRGSLSVTVHSL